MGDSPKIAFAVIIGVVAAVASILSGFVPHVFRIVPELFQPDARSYEEILFDNLDVDQDGMLSKAEFAVVAGKITPTQQERLDIPVQNVTLRTFFQPLEKSTLRSSADYKQDKEASWDGLVQWTETVHPELNLTNRKLSYFLPTQTSTAIGAPWVLYHSSISDDSGMHMRYDPPEASGIQAVLTEILRAFHPRPFLQTRFGPQGGHAVLRARSSDFYDIVFRFHAEFQLNAAPNLPFWFTPGQFIGHIIISHDAYIVRHFRLHVPIKHQLNVDMEIVTNRKHPELLNAEIGFLPQLEARTAPFADTNGSYAGAQPWSTAWTEEITMEEAESALEKSFYPFKQVDYLPFADAFAKARSEGKLVHSIVLWGALDDQSC